MTISRGLFLFSTLFLASASSWAEGGGYADDVSTPTKPVEITVPGDYSVPVPPSLERYASYPVPNVCWYTDGMYVGLGYLLPVELTGLTNSDIRLSGQVKPDQKQFELKGDHGVAQCLRDKGAISCKVIYKKLALDPVQADKALAKEFNDPFELGARREVTRLFMHEPVGIIFFEDKPSPFPPAK